MAAVDVVIPVYNEERVLAQSVGRLQEYLGAGLRGHSWRIVIADNASRDSTLEIARRLAVENPQVTYLHLDLKGRGRALRQAWLESPAEICCYMDVDLSTDLEALPLLIGAIAQEGYDLSIGTRLHPAARVQRSLKREVISRCYNGIIKAMFGTPFSDAQCGFKAISRRAAQELVPLVEDQAWFFDTELLILATKKGYRIKEVPVSWVEDVDSRVNIARTAWEDLKGLWRLRLGRIP